MVRVKAQGVTQATDFAKDLVAELAAERFAVSTDVIHTRLHYDKTDIVVLHLRTGQVV